MSTTSLAPSSPSSSKRLFCVDPTPGFDTREKLRMIGLYVSVVPVLLILWRAFAPGRVQMHWFAMLGLIIAFGLAAAALFSATPDGRLEKEGAWLFGSAGIALVASIAWQIIVKIREAREGAEPNSKGQAPHSTIVELRPLGA